MMADHHYALILAGGSGKRLWPLSRHFKPKQFLCFEGKHSLLQQTVLRLLKRLPAKKIYILTNEDHKYEVLGQLHALSSDFTDNILIEPVAKNTLPAISWGVQHISTINPKALVSVFSSDHQIKNENSFLECWKLAADSAEQGSFTLMGIIPDKAATEYGYIKFNSKIHSKNCAVDVLKFVEKPGQAKANEFIQDGGYLWNAGIFVFQAELYLKLLKKHQAKTYELISRFSNNQDRDVFAEISEISVDHGLVELIDQVKVVPADMGWSDLGGWDALYDYLPKDQSNNVVHGSVILQESKRNLIWSEHDDCLIACHGVDDLMFVQTDDAVFVCKRGETHQIKSLLNQFPKDKQHLLQHHKTSNRPWGQFKNIYEKDRLKVKIIEVHSKQSLSLQMHNHREEHWVVIQGQAVVELDGVSKTLNTGDYIHIPNKSKHRLLNPGNELLKIIEVQSGSYLGEDDIIRFEDKYGRVMR